MLSPLQPLTGSPTLDEIAELLTNLLGEEVKVSRSSTALKVQDVCMLAEYTTEDGETTSVALADLRLANYLGAALAMIPADGAEADVKAQKLVAEVRDNMKEIFNIATSLIAKTGSGHRTLGRVLELNVEQPKGALGALYQAPPFRYDFDVEVPGYGKGRLTYLSPVMHVTDDDIAAASQAGAPPEPVAVAPQPIATTNDSSAAALIPTESDLAKLLCSLTGTEVVVDTSGSPMPSDEAFVVADYVEDDGSLTGVYLADVKSANYLGAALAMIPANAAEKDAHALKLADEVKENLQEIFNAISGSHHRFRRMYLPHKEDLPKELIAVLSSPASRIDFDLSVPGYGNGKFAALAARTAQQEAATTRGSVETPALDEAPAASREAGSGSEPALEGGVLLPDPQSLGELLTGLVGEEVKVTVQSEPVPFQDVVLVGAWQDEARRDRLCFGFDLRIANFLGAALAMIPKDAAHDEIKAQHISDDVFANVNEICNIASGAINQEGSVLLKLNELRRNDAELPAATSRALNGADNRLDLEIELPGYGAGMLAIVVLT
jgi:predicted component of type VI protein secretion system